MRQVIGATRLVLLVLLAGGCALGAPSTFTLNSAAVDASYPCPLGAANAAYTVRATIDVWNGTSSAVTIKSVSAVMTLAAVKGGWLEPVGDKYQTREVTFSPATVGARTNASLKVAIPSACTNGKTPIAAAVYGEYSVVLTVATSAGTQTISAGNRHRIIAASGARV